MNKRESEKYRVLNSSMNKNEKDFSHEIIRTKCVDCNFEFFTHYPNKIISDSCRFKKQYRGQWTD